MMNACSLFARGPCSDVEGKAALAALFLGVPEALGGGIIVASSSPVVAAVTVVGPFATSSITFLLLAAVVNGSSPPSPPNLTGALLFRLLFPLPSGPLGVVSPGAGWLGASAPSSPSSRLLGRMVASSSWPPPPRCSFWADSFFAADDILECRSRKRFSRS